MENTNSSTQNASPSTSPSITVTQPNLTIEPRDLVIAVLLTFITFGFYALYWQYKLTNEIHALSGKPKTASGGMAGISQKKRMFNSVRFLGRGSVRLSLFVCVDGVCRCGD